MVGIRLRLPIRHGLVAGGGRRGRCDDLGHIARRFGGRIGRDVLAERRDLDRLQTELHVREPEPAADDPAVPEQPLDLIRVRVGRDVEVLRKPAQDQVPHAPAHQVRDVIAALQPEQDAERVGIDVPARNRMVRARDDNRLRHEKGL